MKALNARLAASKLEARDRPVTPGHAMVFIVGCARSGSTLLLQWLSASGEFCYPSNIISRFYSDPMVGALVQQALYDLDRRGEIFNRPSEPEVYSSDLGRSKGPVAPHDFGYFWRSHFSFGDNHGTLTRTPSTEELAEVVSDLAGVQRVFDKPMVMKAMQMNWHIPILKSIFPDSIFLFCSRDVFANAWSLFRARLDYFGDERSWYSFKPPEYHIIASLPAWEQCVAQVYFTQAGVSSGLAGLPDRDQIRVNHESFCKEPALLFAKIKKRLGLLSNYRGPSQFTVRERTIPSDLIARATKLLDELQETYGPLGDGTSE